MKVRVIKSFYDRSADMVLRKEGSEFEADGGRIVTLHMLNQALERAKNPLQIRVKVV